MQQTPPTDLRPWFLTIADVERDFGGQLHWPTFFGNDRPIELDIGSGRGLFLVTAGEANPDVNYLGIEIDYREGRRAARRLQRRELHNVRVLGGDVNVALKSLIAPGSVAAAHVYFPDPWWKRKHRKRRVFTDKFLDQLSVVLQPGGLLHSWTDVEDYWEVISALVENHEGFESLPVPAEHEPEHDMDYRTSYERKGRKAGSTIHRGKWRKR